MDDSLKFIGKKQLIKLLGMIHNQL